MSKEWLEDMEVLLNDYYDNIDNSFAATEIAMAIVDKVGYFVNRVRELETQAKFYEGKSNRIEKEKQDLLREFESVRQDIISYREAIESAIGKFNYDEHQEGMATLREVLEESP